MADEKELKEVETEETEVSAEAEKDLEAVEAGIVPGLVDTEISGLVRSSFLDYAMSVIVARAIPDVRDGLKPVHRRIIFGMNETGTTPDKPYKKCARIVGDVMGKYHPHGDSAIYNTLVRLGQYWAMRYMLVDGHGNFGSIDGDEPAAYRYTEARMAKLALEMVKDINCDTVDFVDNYDGVEKEPSVLPSKFPNLIVNGSSGIAVGMATNMPTHNLNETIDAVIAIAKNPELTASEIMDNYLPGPDFPTGGIILGRDGIRDAYETGRGTIHIRSKHHIEESESGKKSIVIDEIPYEVNKALMIEGIATLVKDKVIDGITDVRDESNKEGIRVVIEVRRDVIPEVIVNQLFKRSQLQISYGIINLCLVNGAPKILPMTELLKEYVNHQINVIERRTQFLLAKDEARDHIVLGLLKAQENIDDVVDIIKGSATTEIASNLLKEKYGLDDLQIEAIFAMQLRRLVGLEKSKLEKEDQDLKANIANYHTILSSRDNIIDVMITELNEVKSKFGDERKTVISDGIAAIDDESLIPEEDIVITLTRSGYIKRLTTDTFRTQNRGGRGVKGASTNEGDVVSILLHTKTHTDLMFFSSLGKVYRTRGYMVPESGRNSKGTPVQNMLNLEKDEKIVSIIQLDEYVEGSFLFFTTKNGLVKRTPIEEYVSIRQNGKIAIGLREGDALYDVKHTSGHDIIGMASSKGKMVAYPEDEVRPMGRTATGVIGMDIDETAEIVGVTVETSPESKILVVTSEGFGKMSLATEYRLTKRGTKGVLTLNATEKNGNIVAMRGVVGDEDLMIITTHGIVIRIPLDQIKISGRNTQGVRVIKLEGRQKVASIAIVPHEDASEESDENLEAPVEEVEATEVKEETNESFENDTALGGGEF